MNHDKKIIYVLVFSCEDSKIHRLCTCITLSDKNL